MERGSSASRCRTRSALLSITARCSGVWPKALSRRLFRPAIVARACATGTGDAEGSLSRLSRWGSSRGESLSIVSLDEVVLDERRALRWAVLYFLIPHSSNRNLYARSLILMG